MTIFVFYVNPQTPNIENFDAFEVYKSREVSHLFSHQISRRMHYNHVWGSIFDPSYDHIYKSQEHRHQHQLEVRGFTGTNQPTTTLKPSELLTPRVHENISIYSHIPPYTFIYLHIPSYSLHPPPSNHRCILTR